MQTVSQSYISQTYFQVQNGSTPSANVNGSGKTAPPLYSSSSQQSSDDSIVLSVEGKQLSEKQNTTIQSFSDEKVPQATGDDKKGQGQQALTQEEQKVITELHKRDTEVRSHEQAHLSAAGQYAAGGASFSYTSGPDGKRYANGGGVPIDIGKEKTPEATIQKMRTVRRAALAPANPSSTDRSIAAQASAKEAQAMKELQDQTELSSVSKSSSEAKETEGSQERHRSDVQEKSGLQDISDTPQVSGINRRSMTSAYQAVAALAS